MYSIVSLLIIYFINFWLIRIFTFPLFFFLLGYPISFFISNLNTWERFFLSFGISSLMILVVYYFQYFTCFYLGITPSFHQYATEMVVFFWITIGLLFCKKREIIYSKKIVFQKGWLKLKDLIQSNKYLLCIIIIAIILRFICLNNPDLSTDETFFVGLSYPMPNPASVMGLPSPPFQYFSVHHPPIFHLQINISMNILDPHGWISITDWVVKFLPAFLGTLTVVIYYGIVKSIFNKLAGLISAIFIATLTYAILISRLAYHEVLLVLLLGIVFYFAYQERWGLAGFFIGLSLLVKFSALTIIPPILLYLAIRYLRFDLQKFKILLKNFCILVFIVLILYLPVFIANVASYYEYGYADTFWSRIFGLRDPMTEAVGEAETPVTLLPGLFRFLPLHLMQLINVMGIVAFGFVVFCIILALFDKKEELMFNLILIFFIVEYLVVFTFRWYQIITLVPLIVPFTILASRIVKLIPSNTTVKLPKKHIPKRKIVAYGIIFVMIGFSFMYSLNTVAINHSARDFGDDYIETMNPAYYFSNLGYLWISRNGYDDMLEIIREEANYTVYIDDFHPRFSYYFYFWIRNYTNVLSDWNYENNSLLVLYKCPNNMWEPFEGSPLENGELKYYIMNNCTLIYENLNFLIYLS